jgi:YbbR domain-containing protein
MGTAFRHLSDNLGSMVLALLLAFAVWIAATLQVDPFEAQVYNNVPIALLNVPDDTLFVEPVATQVRVEVRAPRSVLLDLRISDFNATMDLGPVPPGAPVIVPVVVTSSHEAVRIQDFDPAEQTVHLETVRTITLPVSLSVNGEPATGYQVGPPKVSPDQIELHGPDPSLSKVVSVTGSLNIEGIREDQVEQVLVAPRDADGRLVAGVQWSPDRVEVQVAVARRIGYKPDVEVVPDLQISPAEGYRLGSVAVDPSLVTLKGPPSVLQQMPGFVKTFPISVTGATQDLVQNTPLTVPASIVVVGVDFVTVTVEVLPIQTTRAMTSVVEIQGVPPEWTVTASPGFVDVILEGADVVVSELLPEDVQILLNLSGYTLGVHRVEPIVLVPEGVIVVDIIPGTIEVLLEAPRSPTIPTDTLPLSVEPSPML